MAATKGSIAKQEVINKIQSAFGEDFITVEGSKIYVWANDGANGKVQIAASLTAPKIWVDSTSGDSTTESKGDFDWSTTATAPPEPPKRIEVTPEEEANIKKMMEKLGL